MQSPKHARTFVLCTILLSILFPLSTEATDDFSFPQDDDEPLLTQLQELFKQDFLQLGTLLQTGVRYTDAQRGFSLATARLNVQGQLDGGFGYKLQTDFTQTVAVKDAMLSYQAREGLIFDGGRYKTPFSYEELTSSSQTPFVTRSRIVRALAPSRQIGAAVTGAVTSTVNVHAGLFNGNGANFGNNNNRFLYVGRFESISERTTGSLAIGANAAYNDEPNGLGQTILGADFHMEENHLLIGAEAIYGRHKTVVSEINTFGHYLTFGYTLPTDEASHQLLIRWDRFTPDTDIDASNQLLLGYVTAPTGAIRFEANYIIPLEDIIHNHQALIQFQLAF